MQKTNLSGTLLVKDAPVISRQARVLIVADEATIRRLLRQKLSKAGYECHEASNAARAIAWLSRQTVDLMIFDIETPGKATIDMLKEVKTRHPDIPLIVATWADEKSLAIQCMTEGADDFIFKPFKLDEILLSIDRVLEKKELELKMLDYQRHPEATVSQQTEQMRKLFLGAIEALVFTLEAKDKYTAGHSQKVTGVALAIGRELDLSTEELGDLRCSGLLHDVGKIALDPLIQNKPGRLTPEEYEHIMMHAHIGAGIVKPVVNERVVAIIYHHHDRYDGGGLHQTLMGNEIPIGARILALADAFGAMISERPYREAMLIDEALNEIKRCSGTQFDPMVVEAFLRTNATR